MQVTCQNNGFEEQLKLSIILLVGARLIEDIEEGISAGGTISLEVLERAQDLSEKLMTVQRMSRRNLQDQKTFLDFQNSLFDIIIFQSENQSSNSVPSCSTAEKSTERNENDKSVKIIKRQFKKSLIGVEQKHSCDHCSWSCDNFKSLQRHMRREHPEKPKVSSKNLQHKDYYICLLRKRNKPNVICNKQVDKIGICQHLAGSHDVKCPKKSEFKGFLRDVDGDDDSPWKALFLPAKDSDPPEEEFIETEVEAEDVEESNKDEQEGRADRLDEEIKVEVPVDRDEGVGTTEEVAATDVSTALEVDIQKEDSGSKTETNEDTQMAEVDPAHNQDGLEQEQETDDGGMDEDDFSAEIEIQTNTVINVNDDESFQVINQEEIIKDANSSFGSFQSFSQDSESVGSQESIFISGASTNVISLVPVCKEKSLPISSTHNTGYDFLPSVPEAVKLEYWNIRKYANVLRGQPDRGQLWVLKIDKFDNPPKSKRAKLDPVIEEEEKVNDDELFFGADMDIDQQEETGRENSDQDEEDDGQDIEDSQDDDDSCDEEEEEGETTPKRWDKRNNISAVKRLDSSPENGDFITRFKTWWQTSGASCEQKKKETSTLRMTMNYLFHNMDSFLNYQTSENEEFNLSRLVSFSSEDFLSVPSPVSWVNKVGTETNQAFPSRRIEMLKSHQRLREFISHCLNENTYEGDSIQQKDAISKHLKAIDNLLKKKKMYSNLNNLYHEQRRKKDQMQRIIKPFAQEQLQNSIKTWFESKDSEDLEIEALSIYQNAMETKSIRPSDFDRFTKIVFFEAALHDKSRTGMYYQLKNSDYAAKKPTWIPEEMDSLEYENLPREWLLYTAPYDGAAPSSYELEIIGGPDAKNHEDHPIVLSPRVYELIEKMIDLKQILFPKIDLKDYLFVNHAGKKIPKLQNYPASGSLLYQFGLVTKIDNFCFKMFRNKAAGTIQSSANLAQKAKDFNSHSQTVDKTVYDKLRGARRTVFVTNMSKKEGGCSTLRKDKPKDELELKKREERDRAQKDELVKDAEKFLSDIKKLKPQDFRPTAIKDADLKFLKTIFDNKALGMLIF